MLLLLELPGEVAMPWRVYQDRRKTSSGAVIGAGDELGFERFGGGNLQTPAGNAENFSPSCAGWSGAPVSMLL